MPEQAKPIAETINFIFLNKYKNIDQQGAGYQSEADLERELIKDLQNQGYEYLPDLTTPEKMLTHASFPIVCILSDISLFITMEKHDR